MIETKTSLIGCSSYIPLPYSSLFGILVFGSLVSTRCSLGPKADRIFHNAQFWTGDSDNPSATAIATLGESILFVGAAEDVFRYETDDTEVIDLKGKFVVLSDNIFDAAPEAISDVSVLRTVVDGQDRFNSDPRTINY